MLQFAMLVAEDNCRQHFGPLNSYCQARGIAAVGIAVILFIGLPAFILGTNVGFRKGFAILLAALFGYLTVQGFLWMFYPRGPIVATQNADGSPRHVAGLPTAISQRLPAILLMGGAAVLTAVLVIALNRIDRPVEEEPTIRE